MFSCLVFAVDTNLKLFDGNLKACNFLFPDLITSLWHCHSISCMIFKIYHNPVHPQLEFPSFFHPVRETRNAVNSHSHSFSVMMCRTAKYSKCFNPSIPCPLLPCRGLGTSNWVMMLGGRGLLLLLLYSYTLVI